MAQSPDITIQELVADGHTYLMHNLRNNRPADDPEMLKLICKTQSAVILDNGSVYTVLKKALGPKSAISVEHEIHLSAYEAFERLGGGVTAGAYVARVIAKPYIKVDDTKWQKFYLAHFPAGFRKVADILIMERVLQAPDELQEILINRFLPAKFDELDQYCLPMIQLGNKHAPIMRDRRLQQFKLAVNILEALEVSVDQIARVLAGSLAALHWEVNTDANGVEFVLSRKPHEVPKPLTRHLGYKHPERLIDLPPPQTPTRGPQPIKICGVDAYIFCMDFGNCEKIEVREKDVVNKLVKSWLKTDAFPCGPKASMLWRAFREEYQISSKILGQEELALRVIEGIEAETE